MIWLEHAMTDLEGTVHLESRNSVHRLLTRAGVPPAQAWLVMRMYPLETLQDLALYCEDIRHSSHLKHVMGEEEADVVGSKLRAILASEGLKVPGRLGRWWGKVVANIGRYSPPVRW